MLSGTPHQKSGTPRHRHAGLAGVLTLALLAGCTGSSDGDGSSSSTSDGSKTTVELTELKGTEALRPKTQVIDNWEEIVSGKRSTVVVEVAGSGGEPTRLKAVDPGSGRNTGLSVSAPVGWETTVNESAAVVAGDRTKGDHVVPFVRTTTDLKHWEKVAFTYPDRGWTLEAVGLDGDVPLVVAEKPDGPTALFRVTGANPKPHELPVPDDEDMDAIDIVEHRGELVLLYDEGPRGGDTTTRVMTSDDGGRTWQRGKALPGKKGTYDVTGVVSTGKRLIATGSAEQGEPRGTTGMVWVSSDGKTWSRTRTEMRAPSPNDSVNERADYRLTEPTLLDGRASFDQTCSGCTWTTRFIHDGTGDPVAQGAQTMIDDVDPYTAVLAGSPWAGVRWEQGDLITYNGEDTKKLVDGEPPKWIQSLHNTGDDILTEVMESHFERSGNSWTQTAKVTPFVLGTRLKRKTWHPKVLSSWSNIRSASARKDGTIVAAGTSYSDGNFRIAARVKTSNGWQKVRIPGGHEFETATDLAHVDNQFLMAVRVANGGSDTRTRTARVYSSKDGGRWTQDEGTWASDGDSASRIKDICELPGGTPFAVGASQSGANSGAEPTTWRRSNGSWHMAGLADTGNGASFSSCATTDGTTVISGSLNGRSVEWTTTDGKGFVASDPLPPGVDRGMAHEVDGGLVAAGSLATKDHNGPVVWFSTDGKTWQWAPIDVNDAGASVSILTAADTAYAVTSQASGDRIWVIDEIAKTKVSAKEG